METFNIIIAEDDNWYADFLTYQLELIPEYSVTIARSGQELLKALSNRPNLITLDYNLHDIQGLKLLKQIQSISPETAVIIISGQNEVNVAIELLAEGAYDYIVKDVDTKDRLWKAASKVREQQALKGRIEELQTEVKSKYNFSKLLIGKSPSFTSVFHLLEKAAKSSINVSLTGETGTGKEVAAKSIHYNSKQSKNKFVTVNIAAIPRELVESELFGHEKGAFTGAYSQRIGKFEEAQNGTLFIDEIGELELNHQVKLLRVLQEREIQRIGSNKTISVNCRIMFATHKDLLKEVENQTFRQDLYYRIVGLPITLPALRERKEDILILAKHFITNYCKENNLDIISLNEEARIKLLEHAYPGNVRELKTVIELACVMCEENNIKSSDITYMGGSFLKGAISKDMTLKEINHKIIMERLSETNQDISAVAKQLDIGKSSIYRLLKKEK